MRERIGWHVKHFGLFYVYATRTTWCSPKITDIHCAMYLETSHVDKYLIMIPIYGGLRSYTCRQELIADRYNVVKYATQLNTLETQINKLNEQFRGE